MNRPAAVVKDLVLIGGGHSHVTVIKRFGMRPMAGVRLTVIARDVHTPYSGMLPGLVAGHYTFDEAHIDLGPLARFAGARLFHDEVRGLDLAGRRVLCKNRPPVPYDLLSINIGSTPRLDVTGADGNVVPVKPINNFLARWESLSRRLLEARRKLRVGVVGAGAGGVEILLAVQHRLKQLIAAGKLSVEPPEFHLFTSGDSVLSTHNGRTRATFERILKERAVELHAGSPVVEVRAGLLRRGDGGELALDEILWVTQAGAATWLAASGLSVDEVGFVRVDESLQSLSHAGVFAAGDIAAVAGHPREKAGVFAVRQGRPLEENLRRALLGVPLKPFRPQKKFLSIISTGDRYAVASRGTWSIEGRLVWRWKDWIDRRFMRKYSDLPAMDGGFHRPTVEPGLADAEALRELSAAAMRCGGCGAKVGATVLSRVMNRLEPFRRDDVLIGLDQPDDAAVVRIPEGKVTVQTVDSFRAIVDDPYLFGKIAANHSLGDIYAMGGEPQSALAIATLPHGLEEKVEDTLFQMMTGALEVLRAARTALVGGHTSEGAELALGFAVNGLIDPDRVLRKGGMRPGDRLILTKPLGTGTLFAADMRLKAKGRWISAALASMLQSNGEASRCVIGHGATACTDVTGFGLLGHLVEMVKASGLDAEIDLDALPILEGAEETVAAGILSSLQPQNVRLRRAIRDVDASARHPRYPLIFDPQTAGGLLASVPADRAEECLAELKALGYERAAIIGAVHPKSDRPEAVRLLPAARPERVRS